MKDLEYIDSGHLYLYKGVIIPSVSEILGFIFPSKYKDIPQEILNAKAEYGTLVHECTEFIDNNEGLPKVNYIVKASLEQYIKLKKENEIDITNQEQIVCYKGLFAGRYDKEGTVQGKSSLLDVKTTVELDKEYLSWQLSFYELARGKQYEKLYAIWLPKKNLAKLVEIKRKPKKELLAKLKEYLESREQL